MNRAGKYVKNLKGEMAYNSFKPNSIPSDSDIKVDEELLMLVSRANSKLSELNAMGNLIPNADLFIYMYVRKEALISSQIEGTQCTLEDILDPHSDALINYDVADVINYVDATTFALNRMNKLPLCNRLIKEIHAHLLKGVRGKEKNPGEFRNSQNWIGGSDSSLKNARYIPPNVDDMKEAMADLENYMNEPAECDVLVRAALIHYQFETIHPFLDGNGRIGRLLIILYLISQKRIDKPILYISYFLKENQFEYYSRLSEVRRSGRYEEWIKFFLEAVDVTCDDALRSIRQMMILRGKNLAIIPRTNRKSDNSLAFFEYLESHPIIDISKAANDLGVSYNTIASLVLRYEKLGILRQTSSKSRSKVYEYCDYLDILRD